MDFQELKMAVVVPAAQAVVQAAQVAQVQLLELV